jgi:hypothetical protein
MMGTAPEQKWGAKFTFQGQLAVAVEALTIGLQDGPREPAHQLAFLKPI